MVTCILRSRIERKSWNWFEREKHCEKKWKISVLLILIKQRQFVNSLDCTLWDEHITFQWLSSICSNESILKQLLPWCKLFLFDGDCLLCMGVSFFESLRPRIQCMLRDIFLLLFSLWHCLSSPTWQSYNYFCSYSKAVIQNGKLSYQTLKSNCNFS